MPDDHRAGARRPLTRTERSLLDSLLHHDFDGVEALRAQVPHATASTGCECGCMTIDLHVPASLPASPARNPVPVEGTVLDRDGEPIGGLVLFVEHGRLAGLEVHSFDEPLPLPAPERVRWETGEGGEAEPAVGAQRSWWRRRRAR
ncbi:hypothetical protein [Blastococcus deserti]|uniref:Uncharacterized protein n=1 Tax=Blastococcus deserti TaxID=2259033 RepID=A0ABW4X7E3_9ACTN